MAELVTLAPTDKFADKFVLRPQQISTGLKHYTLFVSYQTKCAFNRVL